MMQARGLGRLGRAVQRMRAGLYGDLRRFHLRLTARDRWMHACESVMPPTDFAALKEVLAVQRDDVDWGDLARMVHAYKAGKMSYEDALSLKEALYSIAPRSPEALKEWMTFEGFRARLLAGPPRR